MKLKPLPPAEAIDFFRQKGYAIGFDYRDVWQQHHQAAFTVAKAMQLDLLRDIRTAVDVALAQGETLAQFQAKLHPLLQQRGWWGRQSQRDPLTGEVKDVQLGSPRRTKFIYDTNLRTAHAEGQWTRIQASADALPYLMYDHTPSEHERPEHKGWDGLLLPVKDPWWQSHFPKKAPGCKCRVIQMSIAQVERRGLKPAEAPAEQYETYTNPRTGETQSIPQGVHPMFHYPPGGRRAHLTGFLAARVDALPADLRPQAIRALSGEALRAWAAAPAGDWPIGALPARWVSALKIKTDVVRLSPATLGKQAQAHPEIAAAEYAQVQDALERGQVVQDGQALIFILEDEAGYVTVIKATGSGRAAFVTSFRRLSADQAKRDREIRRLRGKAQAGGEGEAT